MTPASDEGTHLQPVVKASCNGTRQAGDNQLDFDQNQEVPKNEMEVGGKGERIIRTGLSLLMRDVVGHCYAVHVRVIKPLLN